MKKSKFSSSKIGQIIKEFNLGKSAEQSIWNLDHIELKHIG
jgi:hypothetical protein